MKKQSLYKPWISAGNSPRLCYLPSAVPLIGLRESLLKTQNSSPAGHNKENKTRNVENAGRQGMANTEG